MPHRLLRPTRSPIAGLIIIMGAYYTLLGASWLVWPTDSRGAGVEWINTSVPNLTLQAGHVAAWWILGGVTAIVGGALEARRTLGYIGLAAALITPLIVVALFIGSWVDGSSHTGLISALSYILPPAVLLWHVSAIHPAEQIATGMHPIVGAPETEA